MHQSLSYDAIFGSKGSGCTVERLLQTPGGQWHETLLVESIVVRTGPEDKGGRLYPRGQLVRQREVAQEKRSCADVCLHVIALLCSMVS